MQRVATAVAEEVVDMRGADQERINEEENKGHSQLTIAAHLTSYTFIGDKLYKNPYMAH